MNSTPTTFHQNKGTRRRFSNYFKSKVVLFFRHQKELREINSAQENENQQQNSKGGKMEQVYGSMSYISRITGIDRRQISYWIDHGDEILDSKFKKSTFKLKSKNSTCICSPMEIIDYWIG